MALIECPECGKEVSDQAKNCPNCGHPIPISNYTNQNSKDSSKLIKHLKNFLQ